MGNCSITIREYADNVDISVSYALLLFIRLKYLQHQGILSNGATAYFLLFL